MAPSSGGADASWGGGLCAGACRALMMEISQNQRQSGPAALAANHALIKEADGNMREMLTQYEETTSKLLNLVQAAEQPPGA